MQHQHTDESEHIQHLSGSEAIAKMKELAEAARTCFFTTLTESRPLPSRPMAVQTVDEEGSFYFLSGKSSDKNFDIREDSQVQLFFANPGSSEYLSVYGRASISTDREQIRKHWSEMAKVWFQGGVDDPEISLIRVRPEAARYWDTKHGKLVQLAMMAASVLSGKTMTDGVEGNLKP